MKIGILGGGAWGLALAHVASQKAESVKVWLRDNEKANEINEKGISQNLASFKRPANLIATSEADNLKDVDIIIGAIPTQHLRSVLGEIACHFPALPFINSAKGIEQSSGLFLSQMIEQVAPHLTPACLSGPSFADDVVKGLPTALTLAAKNEGTAKILSQSLSLPTFRVYHSDDLLGVEIGGATKNVLAIAAGIVAGKGLGQSALAALISRGFAELSRFGAHLGANPQTLTGLSGLGDLILTSSSPQSRNFAYGLALGRGEPLPTKLAEGVFTAQILVKIAAEKSIDLPICQSVNAVLQNQMTINEAIATLLARPTKGER